MIRPISIEKITQIVQPEEVLLLYLLAIISWGIYQFFLRGVSAERHRNLRKLFQNLIFHGTYLAIFSALFWSIEFFHFEAIWLKKAAPVFGFLSLGWGSLFFIKTCRILLFEYLFLKSMKMGVPLLIVNLLSLVLSLIIVFWILNTVFNVQLAPLLAGSAIFSIVLGLALQDTLGNLIAGVAIQLDKPYEIGDWIEITNHQNKWMGRVEEITWRATILLSFSEEWILIPNRILAQAEISNFSAKIRPFVRSLILRFDFTAEQEKIRTSLLTAVKKVTEVRKYPEPLVLIVDTSESWIAYKLIYYIQDYGRHIIIGNQVYQEVLAELAKAGVSLANQKLQLLSSPCPS